MPRDIAKDRPLPTQFAPAESPDTAPGAREPEQCNHGIADRTDRIRHEQRPE